MIADRYELLGRIGDGASGSVYRAYDHTLDRDVAIKLLQPGEIGVAEREAQILAKVRHRNVVTIHDFGGAGGHRYLVLELLEGQDFRGWLRDRPDSTEIIEHFVAAARGLDAAHRAGLVHRDFKPSNVIRTNAGRVVVIDFGLACSLESLSGRIDRNFAEGTLAYMAPERLAGQENDERSDQFSFCVSLWEALAGSNPFAGRDPLARYRSIRKGPKLDELAHLPRHIVESLARGMSFEGGDRFESMEELIAELERPAPTRSPARRPVLSAIAVAATFLIGWGFAPEGPTTTDAYSDRNDTQLQFALTMLSSAEKRIHAGDPTTAINDIKAATQLVDASYPEGSQEFCRFGAELPALGELMLENGHATEARRALAGAKLFAKLCAGDADGLHERAAVARDLEWASDRAK